MTSSKGTGEKHEVGRRVAEARRRAGLTQRQLADLIGVGERAVQAWELGKSHPYRRIVTLERVLEVDRDWLLHGNVRRKVSTDEAFEGDLSGGRVDLYEGSVARSSRDDDLPVELKRRLAAIERRLDRLERGQR
jgi:transcriptional regulator with XRE-family HTH domain